jgi:cytochrome c peroxidase
VPLGLDQYVPAPETNRLTKEKAELGRELFFWSGLSSDHTLACADCHKPEKAFTDGRPGAVGVRNQVNTRRSPTLLNRAWGKSFFWDGRAASLEEQVLQPIANPKEMDLPHGEAMARIRHSGMLRAKFTSVFRREPELEDLSRALASYVRTILAGDSPYDRYLAGNRAALNQKQQAGLKLFRGKANCIACHVGTNLTDEQFHNTGTGWREGRWADKGRAAVTRRDADLGAFKTPGLREIAQAGPYMHDGSLKTLEEVVDFYDEGGRKNPWLDPEMKPLKLAVEEKQALVEFMKALSGSVREGWQASR